MAGALVRHCTGLNVDWRMRCLIVEVWQARLLDGVGLGGWTQASMGYVLNEHIHSYWTRCCQFLVVLWLRLTWHS